MLENFVASHEDRTLRKHFYTWYARWSRWSSWHPVSQNDQSGISEHPSERTRVINAFGGLRSYQGLGTH